MACMLYKVVRRCLIHIPVLVAAAVVVGPTPASATLRYFDATCITPLAFYDPGQEVHAIATVSVPPTNCSNGWFWITKDDKEIYATALTAAINKKQVTIYYEDQADSVTFAGWNKTTTCRIMAINIKYYQTAACAGPTSP